ncbi:MAG: ribosome rescue protein RqcH [Acidilobaceae archaeon]
MARDSMSNLDVHVWTLKGEAVDCWVDNVYGDPSLFYLKLRCGGKLRVLVIEPSRRIHFTSRPYSESLEGFVVMLRKLVRDKRIVGLHQLGFDRVVSLELNDSHKLFVELLPRGVAALVDSSQTVKALSRSLKTKDRELSVGSEYRPPPLQQENPFSVDPEAIANIVKKGRDLVRGLVRGLGLPGEVAEEAVYRSELLKETSSRELNLNDFEKLSNALKEIYREALEGKGYLFIEEERAEASPFRPLRFPQDKVKVFETLDEALDELFSIRSAKVDKEVEEFVKEREKLSASLTEAEALAKRYMEEASRLEKAVEKLATNYALVESIVECVTSRWRSRTSEECSNVVEIDYRNGVYSFVIDETRYEARYGESPQSIIVRLYKEAGEARARAEKASRARAEIESRLKELELKAKAKTIQLRARARSLLWFERFRWTITTNGFLVLAGRDAGQNEVLVRRYLEDRDIFMHADIHGAPAVVIKAKGTEVSEEDLEDAAVIAGCYSRAWKAGLSVVEVFWAFGNQVSKSAPPGEYVKTGAFMVYGKREYLKVRLALAIGVALSSEGVPLTLVGSERVVSRHSLAYLILVPGRREVDEVELLKKALLDAIDEDSKPYVLAVREQEFRDKVPGKFDIVKVAKGKGEQIDLKLYV